MANNIITIQGISYNVDNIKVPSVAIDQVRRSLLQNDLTAQGLASLIKEDYTEIQQKAITFLESLTKILKIAQEESLASYNQQRAAIEVKQGKEEAALAFATSSAQDKKLWKILQQQSAEAIYQMNEFSDNLKQFLGREAFIGYTPDTSSKSGTPSTAIYKVKNIKDLLSFSTSNGNIDVRIKKAESTLKKLKYQAIDIKEYLDEKQARYIVKVYSQFLTRYSDPSHIYQHQTKNVKKGQIKSYGDHLILWNMESTRPSNHWVKMWFQNTGGIIEGYQRAVFQRKNNFDGSIDPVLPELDMQKFAEIIAQADNAANTLVSDVENGAVSVASKKNMASVAGIADSIKIATELINLGKVDKKIVKQFLVNKKYTVIQEAVLSYSIEDKVKEGIISALGWKQQ